MWRLPVFAGRELRVVMNTNDPDYEHIYSIENYDDPLEEIVLFTPNTNQSKGMPPPAPHHTSLRSYATLNLAKIF